MILVSCRYHNDTHSEYDHEKRKKKKKNAISDSMIELNRPFTVDSYLFIWLLCFPLLCKTNEGAWFLEVGLPT